MGRQACICAEVPARAARRYGCTDGCTEVTTWHMHICCHTCRSRPLRLLRASSVPRLPRGPPAMPHCAQPGSLGRRLPWLLLLLLLLLPRVCSGAAHTRLPGSRRRLGRRRGRLRWTYKAWGHRGTDTLLFCTELGCRAPVLAAECQRRRSTCGQGKPYPPNLRTWRHCICRTRVTMRQQPLHAGLQLAEPLAELQAGHSNAPR